MSSRPDSGIVFISKSPQERAVEFSSAFRMLNPGDECSIGIGIGNTGERGFVFFVAGAEFPFSLSEGEILLDILKDAGERIPDLEDNEHFEGMVAMVTDALAKTKALKHHA